MLAILKPVELMKNFFYLYINRAVGFIAFSCLFLSPDLLAGDRCNPRGIDVCERARLVAGEIAKQLPIQMSANMSWQSIFAAKNLLIANILLGYDESYLNETAVKSGTTRMQMEEFVRKSAHSFLCRSGTITEMFISHGGEFQYNYKFSDGSHYLTVDIRNCK